MGIYDEDIRDAEELIAESGQVCYWQKPAPVTGGTPGYPTVGPKPAPIECRIAFFAPRDLGRGTEEFIQAIVGTEVYAGTEIGLMAGGQKFTPEGTDTIHRGSKTGPVVTIEKIDTLAPNGDVILYFIRVKS